MMICYAGCDAGCKMQDMTGNAWTWHQLGKPSVPLDRGDEIAWKRYKDHWNRSYGLEMASVLRYDTGLRFTASRHLNATQWTCYSHQTWQQNIWQGCIQDAWQKSSTELRPIHPLTGSNKHGKNAYGKQISDLVKLTLVWNFRSGSTLRSNKTTCYRTWTWQSKAWHGATQRA